MKRKKILKQVELRINELCLTGALDPGRAEAAKRAVRLLGAGLRRQDMKLINLAVGKLSNVLATK